ncbi:MAG TPA: hypothetical protein VEB64_09480 [Azospirillaceae bacterium]|nr:hypothetical protein [Azospirillaceae bacterium]
MPPFRPRAAVFLAGLTLAALAVPGWFSPVEAANRPDRVGRTQIVPRPDRALDDAPAPKAAPRRAVEPAPMAPPALINAFQSQSLRFDFACSASEAAARLPMEKPAMPRCADPFVVIEQFP